MSFKKILQKELRERKRLYINDVMEISNRERHYFDTARRKLEPKDTPFAKKVVIGNRIKYWDYLPEKDYLTQYTTLSPKTSQNGKFAQIKPNDKTANEQLRTILLNLKNLTWNDPRVAELQKAIKSKYLETKLSVIKKYETNQ
jgi:hypothetical protein